MNHVLNLTDSALTDLAMALIKAGFDYKTCEMLDAALTEINARGLMD